MAKRKTSKQPARKPHAECARQIDAMLLKLEANPHAIYEVLTAKEYSEAVLLMRAAVAYVQGYMAAQRCKGKRPRPPARFPWLGKSYPLRYGVFLGQVFIANKSGKCLIGSGYHVI